MTEQPPWGMGEEPDQTAEQHQHLGITKSKLDLSSSIITKGTQTFCTLKA